MRLQHACAVIFVVWTMGSSSWAVRGEDPIPSRLRESGDAAWVKGSNLFQHAASVVEDVSMEAWNRVTSNKFMSWAKAEQEHLWDFVLQHLPGDFAAKPRFSDPYLLEAGLCLRVRDALLPTCLSKLGKG